MGKCNRREMILFTVQKLGLLFLYRYQNEKKLTSHFPPGKTKTEKLGLYYCNQIHQQKEHLPCFTHP